MNRNSSGRGYEREFKNNAVALVRGGRTITEVARDLGVSKWSLGLWVRRAEEGQPLSEPRTLALERPEQRELRRLRQELEYVSRQRDSLKKPWASCRRRCQRTLHAEGKARASIWRRGSECSPRSQRQRLCRASGQAEWSALERRRRVASLDRAELCREPKHLRQPARAA
jgi:transposase